MHSKVVRGGGDPGIKTKEIKVKSKWNRSNYNKERRNWFLCEQMSQVSSLSTTPLEIKSRIILTLVIYWCKYWNNNNNEEFIQISRKKYMIKAMYRVWSFIWNTVKHFAGKYSQTLLD